MSEELQQKLRSQLWTVANTLRGNMSASDFMYFTLGFIFYKYSKSRLFYRTGISLLHHHRANQQERKYLAVFRTFTQKNRRFYNRTG